MFTLSGGTPPDTIYYTTQNTQAARQVPQHAARYQ